jgi:hypothetical protein
MRYAERILYEMDLSDDAFDESVYQIKLFYGDQTGEYLQ